MVSFLCSIFFGIGVSFVEDSRSGCDALFDRNFNLLQVTADGSIDCSDDPGRQEEIVAPLLYCEVVAALGVSSHGTPVHSACLKQEGAACTPCRTGSWAI